MIVKVINLQISVTQVKIILKVVKPRSMLPGSGGILQETLFIPANSRRFQTGLQRNRPEKYTEDGSSIPTGISPYRNRDHPSNT
jgi:hypothetical protein